MRPAGSEIIAQWREAGEWWEGQNPSEITWFIDENGSRKESIQPISNANLPPAWKVDPEDPREDYDVRARKRRDEKVAKACGFTAEPTFGLLQPKKQTACLLHFVSGYSFGKSIVRAEEAPAFAALNGYSSALIADRFSLSGAYEFHTTCRKVGIKPIIGASFELDEGGEIILIAKTNQGWKSLSRLVTECHLQEPRNFPLASWDRIAKHSDGLIALTAGDAGLINRFLAAGKVDQAIQKLKRVMDLYGRENVFIQIEHAWLPWERQVNARLLELANTYGLTAVAGGAITHIEQGSFPAQDVLTCVESLCLIDELDGRKPRRAEGQPTPNLPPRRALNDERYLYNLKLLKEHFAGQPELISNTLKLAESCEDLVLPKRTEFPKLADDEPALLRQLVYQGIRERTKGITAKHFARIERELNRIIQLNFCGHFLITTDMCNWARSQGILFSGRGSVVDSSLAYCLGFSRIDAYEHDLHFDRFLPEDASKRPDIDIDFEAARRNDVRNYLVNKYGVEHVATVAAFGAYRTRGIIRDVGKVMGIAPETLDHLKKKIHGSVTPERLREEIGKRPELMHSNISIERLQWVFRLAHLLTDVPMGIRSHSSGVVISREPISETVPVMLSADEDVRIIQWDKRSAKYVFDKFDVLCLRGNDVLSGVQSRQRRINPTFNVEDVPIDEEETYQAMRSGALIGIPQSASPAMRQAHVRLRTENLKDASLVQAGIRPGVGGAVKINELIARRRGKPYDFSHPKLEEILGATYGLIVFQEQVDLLLQTFAGYTSDKAENARESIHKRRREQYALAIKDEVCGRIESNGYSRAIAEEVFELVGGFQGYGFAEGHALAFAEISVRSIWCQQNFPSEFFAALLDAQPAGYYGPCTLVNEARSRGVKILPPHLNRSGTKFNVEDVLSEEDPKIVFPNGGIRISLSQIKGLSKQTTERIENERKSEPFYSYFDFISRVRPPRDELEALILCGLFDSLHPNRRALLWAIPNAMRYSELRSGVDAPDALSLCVKEPSIPYGIEDFSIPEKALYERQLLELDIDRHLMAFERERVRSKGGITADEAGRLPNKMKAFVVGNPIRLRFPPTISGKRVMFFDLEDETGLLNVTCFNETYMKYGHVVICNPYITIFGEAQDRDGHTAFLVNRILPYKPVLEVPEEIQKQLFAVGDFLMS
jgi:error-prone DNA polymerase